MSGLSSKEGYYYRNDWLAVFTVCVGSYVAYFNIFIIIVLNVSCYSVLF